jgi:hypothetical protein
MNKQLLFFVDEGGFDDFTPLFLSMGFDVDFEDSQRKAVQLAKKNRYDILVAEFSYNPEFHTQQSSRRVNPALALLGQGLNKSPIGGKLTLANHPYLCKGLFYKCSFYHLLINWK